MRWTTPSLARVDAAAARRHRPAATHRLLATTPVVAACRHRAHTAQGAYLVNGATKDARCFTSHGSNATMDGADSGDFPYPGGALAASASSRLLKVDNRGTCQLCHDPTRKVPYTGQVDGPDTP